MRIVADREDARSAFGVAVAHRGPPQSLSHRSAHDRLPGIDAEGDSGGLDHDCALVVVHRFDVCPERGRILCPESRVALQPSVQIALEFHDQRLLPLLRISLSAPCRPFWMSPKLLRS